MLCHVLEMIAPRFYVLGCTVLALACGTSEDPSPTESLEHRRATPESTAPPEDLGEGVRIEGYGGRFVVNPSTHVTFAPGGNGSLITSVEAPGRVHNVFVRVGEGAPTLIPGADGRTVGIRSVGAGPSRDSWRVIDGGGSVTWPLGYKLAVVSPGRFNYEFLPLVPGVADTMIVVKWPRRADDLMGDALIASYQRVVSDDKEARTRRLELLYEHEGIEYRQIHVVRVFGDLGVFVTAQTRDGDHEDLFRAAEAVCASFEELSE